MEEVKELAVAGAAHRYGRQVRQIPRTAGKIVLGKARETTAAHNRPQKPARSQAAALVPGRLK